MKQSSKTSQKGQISMKRKILSLLVPLFLVTEVGYGLSDKSPELKTEAVSKTTMKVALSRNSIFIIYVNK